METEYERLLNELKSNPKVIAYLSRFDADSAERFLESYVHTKQMLLQCGENWRLRQHGSTGFYRACAEKHYWLIAQKKLFNLQCLWRAEQISLPVTVAYEFYYWGNNIKTCPFLDEVTETEIEAMIAYLKQAPFDHEEYDPWDWQEYDEFKDERTGIGTGDRYPDWYDAYDNYIGTQHLIALPDIRGKKEEKYLEAGRATGGSEGSFPVQAKSLIFTDSKSVEKFIGQVESYKLLDYFRLSEKETINIEFLEKIEYQIKLFMDESDEVCIGEGKFPDAIFQAGHRLKVSHLKTLLPEIHQEHVERKSMGISYEPEQSPQEDHLIQVYQEQLKKGRKILGEPEDLNF